MFTGIVDCAVVVREVRNTRTGGQLVLNEVPLAGELPLGESVAVNGCCLTVTGAAARNGEARFDLLSETLRVTNLGQLQPGGLVNIERSLRAGDRLSGHYVQGHVDCVSKILDFSQHGQDRRLEVGLPREFSHLVVRRGSICVDGISLTIADLTSASFVCWVIPHTAECTNLRAAKDGDLINLEFDLLAKYVARALENLPGARSAEL
ncbi:MAG: riboflavin synthase [Verrucomicrobiales bacterium]